MVIGRFFRLLLPALVLGAVFMVQGAAAEDLARGEVPAWVEDLPLPASVTRKPGDVDGLHEVLDDQQMRWEGEEEVTYIRRVVVPVTRAGLEQAATVQIWYDPGADSVTLVALKRWRGGQALDVTGSAPAQLLRRETGLEAGILDGSLTAVLQVPDVKVGDMVEYAYVLRHRPYVPNLPLAVGVRLESQTPVDLVHLAVHWPKGREMHAHPMKPIEGLEVVFRNDAKDETVTDWTLRDSPGVPIEDNMAVEADLFAAVRLSEAPDWGPVSAALTPYYSADYPLPQGWTARLDAIRAADPAPEAQALAALRLVQDEIRYVSLSMGPGGYYARKPAEVIESGFGDCKDKALLLRQSLGYLGITSAVALTDLDYGRVLPRSPRALWAFDHAIVRIMIDGRVRWVDPTQSLQGGSLAGQAAPEVGFALPLTGPGQKGLEPVPVDQANQATVRVTEGYFLDEDGLQVHVEAQYGGAAGDSERAWLASQSDEAVQDGFFGYYLRTYPGLAMIGKMRIKDDRAAGVVRYEADARMSRAEFDASGLMDKIVFEAWDPTGKITLPLTGRLWPLSMGAAVDYHQTTYVITKEIDLDPPDPVTLHNPAFDFELKTRKVATGNLRLDWLVRRRTDPIPAEAVPDLEPGFQTLRDNVSFSWTLKD